jgi:hypothetical protein
LIHQFDGGTLSPALGIPDKQKEENPKEGDTPMRKLVVFLSFLTLAFALPAGAQMPSKSLARVINVTVKPGMGPQWEEGVKKFVQWQHQQDAPLAYYVWSIISGPRSGQYVVGTFGHDWKDFDEAEKLGPAAEKQIQVDLEPYTESHLVSYWEYRSDLSGHEINMGQVPPAFSSLTRFNLKPGAEFTMEDVIKAVNAAIQKSHWSGKPSEWYSLVNGGEGPAMILSTGHQNWADFQPPETSFVKMLIEAYGKEGAGALLRNFSNSLRSEESEILSYRPDLSYIPASQ